MAQEIKKKTVRFEENVSEREVEFVKVTEEPVLPDKTIGQWLDRNYDQLEKTFYSKFGRFNRPKRKKLLLEKANDKFLEIKNKIGLGEIGENSDPEFGDVREINDPKLNSSFKTADSELSSFREINDSELGDVIETNNPTNLPNACASINKSNLSESY